MAPSSPEPIPLFCNCSWLLHPFQLPEHGLIWILAIGNLNQVCRNDPETHTQCVATICLPAWLCHLRPQWCMKAFFAPQWLCWCHLWHCPIAAWRTRAETGAKHAGLMSGLWSLAGLIQSVTAERAGSKPAAVQLSEQTRLGLFRKQCTSTPKGWVALPNILALASTSTCCFCSRVNALSQPRGWQQTCGSDSPAYMAGDVFVAATALRWGGGWRCSLGSKCCFRGW